MKVNMILKNTTIALCLISVSFLPAMEKAITPKNKNKKQRSIDKKDYEAIDKEFEEKWGYSIPSIVVEETIGDKVRYMAVAANYVSSNPSAKIKILSDKDLVSTKTNVTSPKVENILTKEGLTAAKAKQKKEKEEEKAVREELASLNKILAEKQALIAQKASENEQLKTQIAKIKSATENIKKEIEQTKSESVTNNTNAPTKQTSTTGKRQKRKQKKQALIIEPVVNIQPTTIETKQPSTQQTNTNEDIQKRRAIVKTLCTWHKVRSENELKTKFAKECRQFKSHSQAGLLHGSQWKYSLKDNSITVDPIDTEYCSCGATICNDHPTDKVKIRSNWEDSSSNSE